MNLRPMKAVLGVLAVAGYQHRDQIGALKSLGNGVPARSPQQQGKDAISRQPAGLGGALGQLAQSGLGSLFGGASVGGTLSNGLGGLVEQFQRNGQAEAASSWASNGEYQPIVTNQLSHALGPDILQELIEKTGLNEQELLRWLSQDLPKAVNDLTPEGAVTEEKPFAQLLH